MDIRNFGPGIRSWTEINGLSGHFMTSIIVTFRRFAATTQADDFCSPFDEILTGIHFVRAVTLVPGQRGDPAATKAARSALGRFTLPGALQNETELA